ECLPAMPEDRLANRPGSAVVEERALGSDEHRETDPPKRRCSPFLTLRHEIPARVGEIIADVVQQEVRIRMDLHAMQMRVRVREARLERRDVARRTTEPIE